MTCRCPILMEALTVCCSMPHPNSGPFFCPVPCFIPASTILFLAYFCSAFSCRPLGPQTTFLICNPDTGLTSFYFPPGLALMFGLTFLLSYTLVWNDIQVANLHDRCLFMGVIPWVFALALLLLYRIRARFHSQTKLGLHYI